MTLWRRFWRLLSVGEGLSATELSEAKASALARAETMRLEAPVADPLMVERIRRGIPKSQQIEKGKRRRAVLSEASVSQLIAILKR